MEARINYLKQIQAFNDYLLYQTKLSSGQIALWHALMQINNKCAWIEWFTAANQTIESLSGLSRAGISKNRNALKQLGLIDFKSNGKKATSYKVCVLYTSNSTQESKQQSTHNSTHRSKQQSTHNSTQDSSTLIKYKQNINETKTINNNINNSDDVADDKIKIDPMIKFWEDNGFGTISSSLVQKLDAWVEDFNKNKDVIIKALSVAVEMGVRKYSYVNTILTNWQTRGFKTLSDIEAAEKQFQAEKEKRVNKSSKKNGHARKEELPGWFPKSEHDSPDPIKRELSEEEKESLEKQVANIKNQLSKNKNRQEEV